MKGKMLIGLLVLLLAIGVVNGENAPHHLKIYVDPNYVVVDKGSTVSLDVYVTVYGKLCHVYKKNESEGRGWGIYDSESGTWIKWNVTNIEWSSETVDNASFEFVEDKTVNNKRLGHWVWEWTADKEGTHFVQFCAVIEKYCGHHKSWTMCDQAVVIVGGEGAETSSEPAVIANGFAENGIVGKESNVSVKVTALREDLIPIPADIVLVMDTSGSMERYGTVIAGPKNVTLTTEYEWIGNFTISTDTKYVEIDLQTPRDTYEDNDYVWIKVCHDGECVEKYTTCSMVLYSHYNLPKGTYQVYAKLAYYNSNPNRIFIVELPPKRIDIAKEKAKEFVGILGDEDRVALVKFSKSAKLLKSLTYDKDKINNSIGDLQSYGGTALGDGIKVAINELDNNGRSDTTKAIVLLTDGWWNRGSNPIDVANEAKEKGYKIYAIGIGGANVTALKEIAEITGGKWYYASDENSLKEVYEDIAKNLRIIAKNVTVELTLTSNVTFGRTINYDGEVDINSNSIIWTIGDLPKDENVWLNFTVISQKAGYVKVADGTLSYDYNGIHYKQPFEIYAEYINNLPIIYVDEVSPESRSNVSYVEVNESETVVLKVNAFDPDGHDVSVSSSIGSVNETGYWTYTPTSDITVTFTAVDEYGASNTTSVKIEVKTSTPPSLTVPTLSLNLNMNITGEGPFVGDEIPVYVINKTAYEGGLINPYDIKGGVKIVANISDVNESNCDFYNLTVFINGKPILYNDTLRGLTKHPYYLTTTFVPLTSGRYVVTASICNTTSCFTSTTELTVYIKQVKQE